MSVCCIYKTKKPCRKKVKEGDMCTYHKNIIKKNSTYKEESCCVCLENFENNFIPLKECKHYVHIECVINSGKDQCPICRVKIKLNRSQKMELKKVQTKNRIEEEERYRQELIREEERFRQEYIDEEEFDERDLLDLILQEEEEYYIELVNMHRMYYESELLRNFPSRVV